MTTSASPSPAAALSDTLERAVAEAAAGVLRVASPRGHATSGGLSALREALRGQQGQVQQLRVLRGGVPLEIEITPVDAPRS